MSAELQFNAAVNKVSDRLTWLLDETVKWSKPMEMKLVSQMQAKPAVIAIAKWGAAGAYRELDLPTSHLRAGMYDLCRIAEQAKVFPTVSCLAVRDLATETLEGFRQGSGTRAMGGLRSMLERMALAAWLEHKMVGFATLEMPTFNDLLEHSEPVTRALYGTGIGWIKLAESELRKLDPKDATYRQLEDSASTERVQILGAIDRINKSVPGARLAYEVLCDFLHPNVGDLLSASADSKSHIDAHGTRHLVRRLGHSKNIFAGAPDLQNIMAQVCDIFGDVASEYRAILIKLDEVSVKAMRVSRLATHRSLKAQRHLFKASDPCPCNSGKSVRQCGLRP